MAKRIIKKNLKQSTPLLSEIYEEYKQQLITNNASKWTVQTHYQAIRKFISVMGDLEVGKINKTVMDQFKRKLIGDLAPRSINTHVTHLRTLLNYCYEEGYTSKIEVTLVKVQKTEKFVPTQEQLQELLIERVTETYSNYVSRLSIMLMATTGIRASELVSLNVSDYHNEYISSRHTKNRDHRYMPLPKPVSKEIKTYIKQYRGDVSDDSPLFTTVYGTRYTDRGFRKIIGDYGIKRIGRFLGTHCLRRYFITHSLNDGVNPILLSKITGHKNVNMLTTYYNGGVSSLINLENNTIKNITLESRKMIRKK